MESGIQNQQARVGSLLTLESIKGLGAGRIAALNKAGVFSPYDLLLLFPARYFDRNQTIDWDGLENGGTVAFEGVPSGKPSIARIRRTLTVVKAKFDAPGRQVWCTWFNQEYIYKSLIAGEKKLIIGKVKRHKNSVEVLAPQLLAPPERDVTPVYKLPKGVPQNVMSEACRAVLGSVEISGYVNHSIAGKHGLLPLKEALSRIHFPADKLSAETAKKSIALEELACTLSVYSLVKRSEDKRAFYYRDGSEEVLRAAGNLPYRLTGDQLSAAAEILAAFKSGKRANILLQGDVGSGKTIVAFLAVYFVTLSGYQAAIMAPTDILAAQHYKNAIEFFEPKGIKVGYLSGAQTKAERETALFNIRNGVVGVVVGTHALLTKNIEFSNLAFTVADEQHRFGVAQRGSLENKAAGADNLIMSATPIPRTLAMTVYGELKQINLKTRPNDALIKTAIVPGRKLSDMYGYIKAKAAAGEKTYIVCPRIESEDSVSVIGLYTELKTGALKSVGVGLLHGQMKETEKSAALRAFESGQTPVLVSTTVIEVGIDVKDATTMVIFGGERFGVSQLHQLRGRVGRGSLESYCFIVSDSDNPPQRFKLLCECSDGFALAEYDFANRGAGDFLGTRQHGDGGAFAGVTIDADMLRAAKAISEDLLADKETAALLQKRAESTGELVREITLS